ncbi:uncharacterized protein LOC103723100 [Phoenix dactylifera]|uniref:Uncharacterized protein LOC103723100 n=1 Tax=Phoenix dactylifera TaxID=42345 RepID=A0A8B7D366_PHODC|nr:uncharacterized protein LOC103723100 [Phoenix dactylifera]
MKNRASTFFKQVVSILVTIVRTKSMAVKSKTSSLKTRLIIFGLFRNKKLLRSAISHKIHALMGQEKGSVGGQGLEDYSKAIVLSNAAENEVHTESMEYDEDDDYPDLTHSLFDLNDDGNDDDLVDRTSSVIDLVRNSRDDASDFNLEDEIDHVADVFIRRFHRQIKLQKQESIRRYQEMLERSI